MTVIATLSNDGINTLTSNDWLQIEQAARGTVSGSGADWSALMIAIAKISGQPVLRFERKSAHWLMGFCEAVLTILDDKETTMPVTEPEASLPEQYLSNPANFEQMSDRLLRAMNNWLAIAKQKTGEAAGKNYVATSLIIRAEAELSLYTVQFNKLCKAKQAAEPVIPPSVDDLVYSDIDYKFLKPGDYVETGDEIFSRASQKWATAPVIGICLPAPHLDDKTELPVYRRRLTIDDDFLDNLGCFNNIFRSRESASVFAHKTLQGWFVRTSSAELGPYVRWMMGAVEIATVWQRSKLLKLLASFS